MNDANRYFRDEAARPRPYAGQLSPSFQNMLAKAYGGYAETDCHFTHTVQLPDGRVIPGQLDLRGAEEAYLGNVPLRGRRVLEYLPGAGGLSAFLAARAGELVVLDRAPGLLNGLAEERAARMRRGWWFTRAALGFAAQAVYADPARPPKDLGQFDVVILNSILSALQHPLLALQHAAELADTLVVVEPALPEVVRAGGSVPPVARFIPTGSDETPAHWQHTPSAIMLMLASVGFAEQSVSAQMLKIRGKEAPHMTIVARGSADGALHVTAAAPPAPAVPPVLAEPPLPGPHLRFSVAGTDDPEVFLTLGKAGYAALQASLAHAGADISSLGRVLDFGCGVGRVLRYWHQQPVEMHGADVNPELTAWSAENLTFAKVRTNVPGPQLDYPDEYFGFVYALSVFTHLPEEIQLPWLRELTRVLRPGGLLYFTTHGDSYRKMLTGEMLERYNTGTFVSNNDNRPGSNYFGTFHPPAYVHGRMIIPLGLELLEFIPEGAAGNPTQDSWLVRKPG